MEPGARASDDIKTSSLVRAIAGSGVMGGAAAEDAKGDVEDDEEGDRDDDR